MRLRPLLAPLTFVSAVLVAATSQAAPTGTLGVGNPEWVGRPPTEQMENEINRHDCLDADAVITFNVTIGGPDASNVFEIWSGQGCETKTNRDENNTCVKVFEGVPLSSRLVELNVKDIVQREGIPTAGIGTGTDATCDESSTKITRSLYFLILDPSELEAAPISQPWEFSFDLKAPPAPTAISAGPGENSLVVNFKGPTEGEPKGYRLYCAADEGGCSSSVLAEGGELNPNALPEGVTPCGRITSEAANKAEAGDLANGTSYVVGVVAEDDVGNISELSAVACGIPKEVTGFYEAYRAAGGQAGGGFCGFAPAPGGKSAIGLALLLTAVAFVRRRR